MLVILLLGSRYSIQGQSFCGSRHPDTGTFICYPEPALAAAKPVADSFHLSAQANAPAGHLIRAYLVLIDGTPVYRKNLALPQNRLSIETNIVSPYQSGSHTLSLVVDNAGKAEVNGIVLRPASELGFCDEFSRLDARACVSQRNSTPLSWNSNPQQDFADNLAAFTHRLARLQADTADAAVPDAAGNLFVVSHSLSDIEIRKYRPEGSIGYDRLVRLCSSGFVSVSAIALHDGRLWLAGNTNACLETTPGALISEPWHSGALHAFLVALDITRASDSPLIYSTWLPPPTFTVAALRVDPGGNAYVAGTAESPGAAANGFVYVLSAAGSALISSFSFPGVRLNALALDRSGNIYVTGRTRNAALIAGIDSNSHQVFYRSRLSSSVRAQHSAEGRAIALNPAAPSPQIVVIGDSDHPFLLALEPCRTGQARLEQLNDAVAQAPDVALKLSLDQFVAGGTEFHAGSRPTNFVTEEAPACSAH